MQEPGLFAADEHPAFRAVKAMRTGMIDLVCTVLRLTVGIVPNEPAQCRQALSCCQHINDSLNDPADIISITNDAMDDESQLNRPFPKLSEPACLRMILLFCRYNPKGLPRGCKALWKSLRSQMSNGPLIDFLAYGCPVPNLVNRLTETLESFPLSRQPFGW